MNKIDRLQFLQLAGVALGAGVATAAAACGGDDSKPAASATCNPSAPAVKISQNHGHDLSVSGADVTAAVKKDYTTTGTATHVHMVTITDVNFQALAGGKSITATSTTGGLDGHTITVC